ncbi:MAG TPA: hypothetical protein V6D22_09705 [Candidatus Obscuribacterales bacterium]
MKEETLTTSSEHVLVLSGLYPGTVHCDLVFRDFNQELLLARVVKPEGSPQPGTLMPVLVQSGSLSEDMKSRLRRRFKTQQVTTFLLGAQEFTGQIVQMDMHQSPVADNNQPAQITSLVIRCVNC